MIFDNHLHTKFSSDSQMTVREALQAAEKLGLGLVVTEHWDYDYIDTKNYQDMDFRFEPEAYWEEYASCRGSALQLGVEVGLTGSSRKENIDFLQRAPFDQVIGSIHTIDMLDLYYPDFYEGKTKQEAYGEYLTVMAEMIRENPYIDILGHIDYICRYAPYPEKLMEYADFSDLLEEVLRAILETGTVLELNTRRLGDRAAQEALLPVYRRYRELGGRYITLGSDAHTAENIGMNFQQALDMAAALELQPVTFSEREMLYCR